MGRSRAVLPVMRKSLVLAVVLALAVVGWAQDGDLGPTPPAEGGTGEAAATPPPPPIRQYTGTLTAVDPGAGTVTVTKRPATDDDPAIQSTFRLTDETEILLADEPGAATGLTTDQRVQVRYRVEGAEPYAARRVSDAETLDIRKAEREGVAATVVGIEERERDDRTFRVLVVDTVQGKRRELVPLTEGAWAAEVWRDGQTAELDTLTAGQSVMVSLRRTGGETMYLKAVADPPTYRAFLADRTVRGRIESVDGEAGTFVVTPEGGEAAPVRVTRATVFFQGAEAAETNPFNVGDEVVVKFRYRRAGVAQAKAVFAPGAWRAYADHVAAEAGNAEPGDAAGG